MVQNLIKNLLKQHRKQIPDEWDKSYIAQKIVKHKIVLEKARYPGSGKTESCKELYTLGYRVLFVCPTNVGAQKTTDNEEKHNPHYVPK